MKETESNERKKKRERHRRPAAERAVGTRFFNTYWQLRRRSDPCGCASCAPSTPRRRGRACGILDSWLRSGRRSGRRVAGTQHAVATPFLGGPEVPEAGTRGAPVVESRPREYHHRVANQKRRTGRAQNRTIWPVRVKAPINRRHHRLLLCIGNSCRVCLVGTLWYRALAGFPVGQVRSKRKSRQESKKKRDEMFFFFSRNASVSYFNNDPLSAAIYSLLIQQFIYYILYSFNCI